MKVKSSALKWKTYFITYSAYVALHAMRMTYSQVKPYFQVAFNLSTLFLGILDGLVYTSLALGFALRFLISSKKVKLREYLIYTLIAIAGFLIIPILSLTQGAYVNESVVVQKYLPTLGLIIFGFFQFAAWPTLLTITNEYFDVQKQGSVLGFWTSNGNVGNIVGFAISGLIIDMFQFRWQTAMIAVAVLQILIAFQVYIGIQQNSDESTDLMEEDLQNQAEEEQPSNRQNFIDFINFSKKLWQAPQNKLFLIINGILKSVLYGFLLWMPLFLSNQNLTPYISTVPIVFNFGTMLGSFVLGSCYEQIENDLSSVSVQIKKNLQKYSLFYSCIIVVICQLAFYLIKGNIPLYFILSALCGFFLGGTFNMLVGNQVLRIVGSKAIYVNYLATLSMMANNLVTGLSEVVIGLVLNLSKYQATSNDEALFFILMCMGIVSGIFLFIRTKCYSKDEAKKLN